jgi:hypothetical protein
MLRQIMRHAPKHFQRFPGRGKTSMQHGGNMKWGCWGQLGTNRKSVDWSTQAPLRGLRRQTSHGLLRALRGHSPALHLGTEATPSYVVRLPEPCATVEEWVASLVDRPSNVSISQHSLAAVHNEEPLVDS